jgi:integrase
MSDILPKLPNETWSWNIDSQGFDRDPKLTSDEIQCLHDIFNTPYRKKRLVNSTSFNKLKRLFRPLEYVLAYTGLDQKVKRQQTVRTTSLNLICRAMYHTQVSYWGFSRKMWLSLIGKDYYAYIAKHGITANARHQILAIAYLLGDYPDVLSLGRINYINFAQKIFGKVTMDNAIKALATPLSSWGYSRECNEAAVANALSFVFIQQRSCSIQQIKHQALVEIYENAPNRNFKSGLTILSYVLYAYGIIEHALGRSTPRFDEKKFSDQPIFNDLCPAWVDMLERWLNTSTRYLDTRTRHVYGLLKVCRWDMEMYKTNAGPENWTRETCLELINSIENWTVGEFAGFKKPQLDTFGNPLAPATKIGLLGMLKGFFIDIQDWEWIPRKFDPNRYLKSPTRLNKLLGPDPKVIEDAVWAKLMWAGLNLTEEDIRIHGSSPASSAPRHPLAMVRAVAMVWLFAGLRKNEIHRLRTGCIRWDSIYDQDTQKEVKTCLLDVPVTKNYSAYTKPVDSLVGQMINIWEKQRPPQPLKLDAKTNEMVEYVFQYRNTPLGSTYLNETLIPMLCAKAGVPGDDAKGTITSHRARATIASQLYNAREPLSLYDLQQWLGHKELQSTTYYTKISPTRLTKAYISADYFAKNLRAINVLVDRDVVKDGNANVEPWKFYDLGHGYCTYDFFDQCPHRMACAKCDFYEPKTSARSMMLEGKSNLLRLVQEITLTDDERLAVEDGVQAYESLLDKLKDISAPNKKLQAIPIISESRSPIQQK